jgi:hypothetical protein
MKCSKMTQAQPLLNNKVKWLKVKKS